MSEHIRKIVSAAEIINSMKRRPFSPEEKTEMLRRAMIPQTPAEITRAMQLPRMAAVAEFIRSARKLDPTIPPCPRRMRKPRSRSKLAPLDPGVAERTAALIRRLEKLRRWHQGLTD